MTGLQGFATSLAPVNDIVCAYSTSPAQIPASLYSMWHVIGDFSVPQDVDARLSAIAFISEHCWIEIALFEPAKMAASVITFNSPQAVQKSSPAVHLVAGITYKIAARVFVDYEILSPTARMFGVIRTAFLGSV